MKKIAFISVILCLLLAGVCIAGCVSSDSNHPENDWVLGKWVDEGMYDEINSIWDFKIDGTIEVTTYNDEEEVEEIGYLSWDYCPELSEDNERNYRIYYNEGYWPAEIHVYSDGSGYDSLNINSKELAPLGTLRLKRYYPLVPSSVQSLNLDVSKPVSLSSSFDYNQDGEKIIFNHYDYSDFEVMETSYSQNNDIDLSISDMKDGYYTFKNYADARAGAKSTILPEIKAYVSQKYPNKTLTEASFYATIDDKTYKIILKNINTKMKYSFIYQKDGM